MSRAGNKFQEKYMSLKFRGKEIFKPLNTGWIDEHVACVREYIANIFFYTKNGKTIMLDAGYNYERLEEKMGWLGIAPKDIDTIFITHQDTDHIGALETNTELLFKNATVYIGEIENRYLTAEVRRKVYGGYSFLDALAEDNELAKRSLAEFAGKLRSRGLIPIVITGHTGWYDDLNIIIYNKTTGNERLVIK